MRLLSSNEADWERRHPVTLLFFLFLHLYILTYLSGDVVFAAGLIVLLLIERRLPWGLVGLITAFGLISYAPIFIGWDISLTLVLRQLLKLAAFMLGMIWVSRLIRIERMLPLFSRWPRSSKLLYGAWALIPSIEQAVRLSLRSHPKHAWREAVLIGVESQHEEPRFAVEPMRRVRIEDGTQLIVLFLTFLLAVNVSTLIWLFYPYLTKGGMRDALVILYRRFS